MDTNSLNDKSTKQFIREMFSEGNNGSSKRVVGILCSIAVVFCTIFLTITCGGTEIVKDLLQTMYISSCALLGVSCVSGIFKKEKKDDNT